MYCDPPVREKVFEALKDLVPGEVNPNFGRKGMNLWAILVL